jgi:hypothetical protein
MIEISMQSMHSTKKGIESQRKKRVQKSRAADKGQNAKKLESSERANEREQNVKFACTEKRIESKMLGK